MCGVGRFDDTCGTESTYVRPVFAKSESDMRAVIGIFSVACLLATLGCGSEPAPGGPSKEQTSGRVGSRTSALTAAQAGLSQWSDLTTLSLVPVAAANLADGKVLLWAADDPFTNGTGAGRTYSVVVDPQTS